MVQLPVHITKVRHLARTTFKKHNFFSDALKKVNSASKNAITSADYCGVPVDVAKAITDIISRYIRRGLLDFSIGAVTLQKISIIWKIIFIILLCILVVGSIGLFVGLNFLLIMGLSKIPLLGIQIKTNSAGFIFSIAIVIFSPFYLVISFILEVIKESVFKGREVYKNIFDMVTTYLVTYLFICILDYYLTDILISHLGIATLTLCYKVIFELYEYYEPLINRWSKKNQNEWAIFNRRKNVLYGSVTQNIHLVWMYRRHSKFDKKCARQIKTTYP